MILGICGQKKSGKTFTAELLKHLFELHGVKFEKRAFAAPLKEACRTMFLFTDDQLYGDDDIKNQVDPRWGVSPRFAMQTLGTEYGRDTIRKDIWIKRMELEVELLESKGFHTLIDDVRFLNEAEWVRSMGGTIIGVQSEESLSADDQHPSEKEMRENFETMTDVIVFNCKTHNYEPCLTEALDSCGVWDKIVLGEE